MKAKQLILDAGGVIVTDLTPGFWEMIAAAASRNYADIRAAYAAEIRDGLWNGALPEADFWRWLRDYCPEVDTREAQAMLHRNLQLLPAYHLISEWSRLADVHLLSNHRAEWLAPYLKELRPYLRQAVISSEAGASKPSPVIFARLHERLETTGSVLYVDDQQRNIRAAEEFGWQGLLADKEGRWIEAAQRWLAYEADEQA